MSNAAPGRWLDGLAQPPASAGTEPTISLCSGSGISESAPLTDFQIALLSPISGVASSISKFQLA